MILDEVRDEVRFTVQNAGWSTLNPKKSYAARKAMKAYRKVHPVCEVTGSNKRIQIHHIIPVWAAPELAADPDNFIALSIKSNIHLIYGHAGSFRKRYIANIRNMAEKMRELYKEAEIISRNV